MQVQVRSLDAALPEIKLITLPRFEDERGWFCESYSAHVFAAHGVDDAFVQDNQSFSALSGTVRGLHFQAPPHAQAKLVRCLRGRVLDVAVDIRRGSPTYGRHAAIELSEERPTQLYIPAGFAHGFVTRAPATEVVYKVNAFYSRDCDRALRWDDLALGIEWGITAADAILSPRDAEAPSFADFVSPFAYQSLAT